MEQLKIGKNEAGKRIDAVAAMMLPKAGKSFVYKMLRKKNIVLNGKKAEGNDRVSEGDVVTFFLSEETFARFSQGDGDAMRADARDSAGEGKVDSRDSAGAGKADAGDSAGAGKTDDRDSFREMIIYEDEDIIIFDKPAGMLSQKAERDDISANELMIRYLQKTGKITSEQLRSFRPSVCNRLDRNTSGIMCAGVSLKGSRELTRLIRERKADKYYLCIVRGVMSAFDGYRRLLSYLSKDEKNNRVTVRDREFEGSERVEIEYRPLKNEKGHTLLKVRLITGKSHQIRAQLAAAGYPIAGDPKYGDRHDCEELRRKYNVKRQLLSAVSITFPEETELDAIRGRTFATEPPEDFFIKP